MIGRLDDDASDPKVKAVGELQFSNSLCLATDIAITLLNNITPVHHIYNLCIESFNQAVMPRCAQILDTLVYKE